jgi:multidrug efflux pump subunit AcrA (membrane-fusion protein)
VIFPAGSPQLASLVLRTGGRAPGPAIDSERQADWNEDKTVRYLHPFAGRVSRILVQPGDRVKQGQTLAIHRFARLRAGAVGSATRARSDYFAGVTKT